MVYIDNEFRCHTSNPNVEYREVEDSFFDDKCVALIEAYRFVPEGETYVREDGEKFVGKMITPAVDDASVWKLQEQYEAMLAEAAAAYQEGVNSV
jgi:hypothetical protein